MRLQIPRTGTMWFLNCGARSAVYAFVASSTFLALMSPRSVLTSHRPSSSARGFSDRCVTGVMVCRLAPLATTPFSRCMTILYGHTWPAVNVKADKAPLTPETWSAAVR